MLLHSYGRNIWSLVVKMRMQIKDLRKECCQNSITVMKRTNAGLVRQELSGGDVRHSYKVLNKKLTPWFLVRKSIIPTERPPPVGEVNAKSSGRRVSRGQRNWFPRPLLSHF
jgi:hypothetical protein